MLAEGQLRCLVAVPSRRALFALDPDHQYPILVESEVDVERGAQTGHEEESANHENARETRLDPHEHTSRMPSGRGGPPSRGQISSGASARHTKRR